MHLLIVEDHETVAENMKKFLGLQDYKVTVANDGNTGLEIAMTEPVDLVILDINLPGMDGYTMCDMLRKGGKNVPILMLTARSKQEEVVRGLNLGADDYLTKPFDLDVLLARVRALLRRNAVEKAPVLTAGSVTIDTNARGVTKGKKKIPLAPKEYALLEYLVRNKGLTQDRPTILAHVWGNADGLMFSQTVDVHVAFLRKKLGKSVIETVPGSGYRVPA
jgi:DNA-binding response OmpR family regulator